ncbi:YfhO family protein [Patescibacteria group bacterium]|nr:YfhO family protein [Patescibacteria group bacterium]
MKEVFKKYHLILIPLISLIIIFCWFYEGKLISNGSEEDLSIFHSEKSAQYYSTFWYPVGTGFKTPFHFVRYPTFFVLGILEQNDVPAFFRQALLLWVLMVAGIGGMYFFLKKCFRISTNLSLIGSMFYLLNVYSMTQVWKRFLYHGIFAWAYLPLFIFLWVKWIDSKKIIWLFIFLLTSLFFSYTFSQPAFIITIWSPAAVFILFRAWQLRSKVNEVVNIFLKAGVGLLLWCVVNIWWLYPMLTLGSTWNETTGQTWQSDLSSLHAVSKSFPVWEVLLLRQSWYLSSENDFGSFYQNPLVFLLSILVLYFVVRAIVKLKQYPYRGFVLILAFVALFISKGTSFPFGYTFFYLLFSNFNFTTAFRNSYEKFGIVWLFAYTILFTLGFSNFLSSLKPNKRFFIAGGILFLILILVLPFWSGGVFPKKHRLNIPQYYNDANNYLNQRSNLSNPNRVFHIPFLVELERSIYTWGYIGQDPSQNLLNQESVTTPKIPLYYSIAKLQLRFLNNEKFPKLLGLLSVDNVILHKDNIYPKINIEETIKSIEKWEGLRSKKEVGELIIYSLDEKLINPRIYAAGFAVSVSSIEEGLAKIISDQFDTKQEVFIVGNNFVIPSLMETIPLITFEKISADRYLVKIKEAKNPFVLVLNNTFDKLWQATIDNQIINKHFIVNGFANGWLIEKIGDYSIDIRLKMWPWD